MVTIRLTRVQNELNKLEDKKHFKFTKGDIAEKDCRDEMEKLSISLQTYSAKSHSATEPTAILPHVMM